MKKLLATTALIALMMTGLSGLAAAQTAPVDTGSGASVVSTPAPIDPNGANQINSRLQDQQKRINEGVKNGTITPEQAAKDQKLDDHVAAKLNKDVSKNGGAITTKEEAKMNKKLDKNSHRIHHQRKKNSVKKVIPTTAPVTQ